MSDNHKSFSWRIEPSEGTCWVAGIAIVATMICLLAHLAWNYYEAETIAAIKAGLVQTPNVGTSGYHWTKP